MIIPGITSSVNRTLSAPKGVTMTNPSDYYTSIPTYFEANDSTQEITFLETPGSVQGDQFTIALQGNWGVGFGNTPSTVSITLRSPSNWVAGPASTPKLTFSYQTGPFIFSLSNNLTITFTAANQSQTEEVTWIGGNSNIDFISPEADGEDIGFIIENIVFNPEPTV